ncbi:MAG: phosphatidylglycerophosphatase A [Candidatus Omnitrophica bacterium]|nr:phosphatidylglycerophosphatase A [Candidatus Omnitrophota bacterium]
MNLRPSLVKLLASFFYLGFLPVMPGTFGSLGGLLLFFLVSKDLFFYTLVTLCLLILGFLICGRAEEVFKKKDPRYVVIDEVVGMLISLFLIPYDFRLIIIGFLLFRLFDTLKPYPASSFQNTKGSLGIMGDDIVAGLYTNLVLSLLVRFAVFKIS